MKRDLILIPCLFLAAAITACGGKTGKTAEENSAHSTPVSYIDITESIKEHTVGDTIQMGRIAEGEVIKNTVAMVNSTASPMVVLNVELSCGCTSVEFDKHPIQPADTLLLTFRFDSRGFSGFQRKSIKVGTSLSHNPCTIILLGDVVRK